MEDAVEPEMRGEGEMRFNWVLVAGSLAFAGDAFADSVRVCTTDWPPYTVGAGIGARGVHTQVVTEAFRRIGLEARIDSVAWERCWKELPKDTYQAIYSASYSDSRARVALYPATPLQRLSYVAVVRGDTSVAPSGGLDSLPRPLASPHGYSITEELRRRGHPVDDGAIKDSQNLEKLLAGRVGAAVMERQVAAALIRGLNMEDKVRVLPASIEEKDYFLVIGRQAGGSPEAAAALAGRLEGVLADLRREHYVDRLLATEAER